LRVNSIFSSILRKISARFEAAVRLVWRASGILSMFHMRAAELLSMWSQAEVPASTAVLGIPIETALQLCGSGG
jgi:hypothetical protein